MQIAALNAKIRENYDKIDAVEDKITSINDNLPKDLKNDITNIKSDIISINDDLEEKQFYIDGIASDVRGNNTLLANLPSDLESKYNDIINIKSTIDNINFKYTLDYIHVEYLEFDKILSYDKNSKLLVHEFTITNNFEFLSYIKITESILYHYNLKNSYYLLQEKYEIYDDANLLFSFPLNAVSKGLVFYNLNIFKNTFYYQLKKTLSKITIKLYLEKINQDNNTNLIVTLEKKHQFNFITIEYIKAI